MNEPAGLPIRGLFYRLCVAGALLALAAHDGIGPAQAGLRPSFAKAEAFRQAGGVIRVSQLDFSVDGIEGAPGQDLPVKITLPSAGQLSGAGAFILVRNIPAGVRFSSGMASGRFWVLALHDAEGLRLFSEPNLAGSFSLEFSLIGPENRALARQVVALSLKPIEVTGRVGTAAPPVARAEPPAPQPAPAAPSLAAPSRPRLSVSEEAVLVSRGEELMRQGGIAAARIIFEDLAGRGSARAALALAQSYDPAYVPKSAVSALTPNLETALKWYRRAEELGSGEAKGRAAEIAARR